MGFIRILRWRVDGALRRSSDDSSWDEKLERAAIFAFCIGRKNATRVFDELTSTEKQAISEAMNRLHELDEETCLGVLEAFLRGLSNEQLPSYLAEDDAFGLVCAHAQTNPSGVAERLRELWLGGLEDFEEMGLEEFEDDFEDDEEIFYKDLDEVRKAAVFLMWLPPELSSKVLEMMEGPKVHLICDTIMEMPFVVPEAKEQVLSDFMDGLSLGVPGLALEDVGIPVLVESFVRNNPQEAADRLSELWLDAPPSAPSEPLPPKPSNDDILSGLVKAAIFFQTLSLPLAYRLLQAMEEGEVTEILDAVNELDKVEGATRKEVLLELMKVASDSGGSADIQQLSGVLAGIIQDKPQLVARRVRRLWLGKRSRSLESSIGPKWKVAVLLMILAPDLSARLSSLLDDDEVKTIALEMAGMPDVPLDLQLSIIREFSELCVSELGSSCGFDEKELLTIEEFGARVRDHLESTAQLLRQSWLAKPG